MVFPANRGFDFLQFFLRRCLIASRQKNPSLAGNRIILRSVYAGDHTKI